MKNFYFLLTLSLLSCTKEKMPVKCKECYLTEIGIGYHGMKDYRWVKDTLVDCKDSCTDYYIRKPDRYAIYPDGRTEIRWEVYEELKCIEVK
jgi:hypothetical protein